MDLDVIEQSLKEIDTLQVFTTNLNGRLIALQVNPHNLNGLFTHGIGFDGSSVPGHGTVDDSDKLLIPLAESFRVIDFKHEKLGFLISKVEEEYGERAESDARALLEKTVQQAETEFGLRFLVGPEHEFFLLTGDEFNKDIHTDKAGYFHPDPQDRGEAVRKEIVGILEKTGIVFEKMHHEVTPSQHEINLGCLGPLEAADRTLLFGYITKRVAHDHGLHATFMPKPFNDQNRSALHIHISAQTLAGEHVFFDPDGEAALSRTARRFIGGILKYARETSIIMASTYNSYKAYVVGKEAPIVRGWGIKNRSSMVRVPYAPEAKSKRVEIRSPDPSGNIYMQIAALIAMGLQGLREELDCGAPDAGSTYENNGGGPLWDTNYLPRNLFEALVEAERSEFLESFLGESLCRTYLGLKKEEWEAYRTNVTPREHKMNLWT